MTETDSLSRFTVERDFRRLDIELEIRFDIRRIDREIDDVLSLSAWILYNPRLDSPFRDQWRMIALRRRFLGE